MQEIHGFHRAITAHTCNKQTILATACKLLCKVYPTLYDDRPNREIAVNYEHRGLKRNAFTWMRIGASSIEDRCVH